MRWDSEVPFCCGGRRRGDVLDVASSCFDYGVSSFLMSYLKDFISLIFGE